ncbi:MAG TPA: LAGLIDADG family homing endonuclease [Patescibacteria group bacterium]|nr:LAGLIDADG family homing endonuclease [Patescibacteria group bacterium]
MKKAQGKVKISWSPNFAYAIGLIVTDGCLSKNGRHIDFTSKDLELVETFLRALEVESGITKKSRKAGESPKYFRVQIGDVCFYRYLESIGITQRKSKTIGSIEAIPPSYFADFLRGHLDGDGHFYSYWDPRWKSSFMYYTVFNSASKKHIYWLQETIERLYGLKGHVTKARKESLFSLKYAKTESDILLKTLYYKKDILCLDRKRLKIFEALSIVASP